MLKLFLALVVAGILLLIIQSSGFANVSEPLQPAPSIKANSPTISLELKRFLDPAYEYKATFGANLEYSGRLDRSIDVIAVVNFRDADKKATVNGKEYFSITKSSQKLYGEIVADNIVSLFPPVEAKPPSFKGEMKKYQSFFMKDIAAFVITLDSTKREWVFFKNPEVGPVKLGTCWVGISIECDESKHISLRDSCETKDNSECEQYLSMCNAEIHIKASKVDCDNKKIDALIEVKGGKEGELKESTAEKVMLTFWKKTLCTDNEDRYRYLVLRCSSDFLGFTEARTSVKR